MDLKPRSQGIQELGSYPQRAIPILAFLAPWRFELFPDRDQRVLPRAATAHSPSTRTPRVTTTVSCRLLTTQV